MFKKNILKFFVILIGVIVIYIYFHKTKFGEYNLKKSVSACVLGQKKKSKSFDPKKARKYCEEEIRKKKQD